MLFCSPKEGRRVGDDCCSTIAHCCCLLCWFFSVDGRHRFPLFVFIRLFLYELDWPGFHAVLRCPRQVECTPQEPGPLRSGPDSFRSDFCTLADGRTRICWPLFIFPPLNFSTIHIFHSRRRRSTFFLSFLFQSHTQREKCQRGHVLRRPSGHFRPFASPGRCLTVYSLGATDFTGPRAH